MSNIETGLIEGDVDVTQNFQLDGTITGSVTVNDNVHFHLLGTVINDVLIKKGGSAQINGTVNGNIVNEGGFLRINGVVRGSVQGDADIDPNAVVGNIA